MATKTKNKPPTKAQVIAWLKQHRACASGIKRFARHRTFRVAWKDHDGDAAIFLCLLRDFRILPRFLYRAAVDAGYRAVHVPGCNCNRRCAGCRAKADHIGFDLALKYLTKAIKKARL